MQAYLQKHSQYIEQAARWHHLCSGGQAHKLVAVPRHRKTVITDPNNPLKTEQTVQYCVVVGAEAADAAGATKTHNSSSLVRTPLHSHVRFRLISIYEAFADKIRNLEAMHN